MSVRFEMLDRLSLKSVFLKKHFLLFYLLCRFTYFSVLLVGVARMRIF